MRRSEKADLVDDGESVSLVAVVGETWASSLELLHDGRTLVELFFIIKLHPSRTWKPYLSTKLPSPMLSRDGMLGCELLVGRGVVGFAVTDDLVLAELLLLLPLVSELTR
jgi:hypothetical protein